MKFGLGIDIKKKNIKRSLLRPFNMLRVRNKQKIFCVGLNKTGTTSLERAMRDLKFSIGDQRQAELLFDDWVRRDFKGLIRFCKTAVFFQDSPFSHPYTFMALDQAFPGSKFILTVRNDPVQWYESLIKFHGKMWGKGNIPPTAQDLKEAVYITKGYPYHIRKHLSNVPDDDLYNKEILLDYYNSHNKTVKDYFRFRKKDLLILNVAEEGAYGQLTNFLNIKTNQTQFPWENKTDEK